MTPTHLDVLRDAGIITAGQFAAAQAHPDHADMRDLPTLTEMLVWLRVNRIIDTDMLQRAAAHVAATAHGDERDRYLTAIREASGPMFELDKLHEACFRRLRDHGWITHDQYKQALAAIGDEVVLHGPGGLLAWLVGKGIIGTFTVEHIREVGNPKGDPERAEMLEDVERVFGRKGGSSRARWLYAGGGLLLAGVVGWMIFAPDSAPDCTHGGTKRSLEQLFLSAALQRRDAVDPKAALPEVEVGRISEVGNASALRVRACKTTVTLDGASIPYAFTIGPDADGKDFVIAGAKAAIVDARFGNIDAEGNFGNKAEPVGRAEVKRALRAGVVSDRERRMGLAPGLLQQPEPTADMANAVRRKFGLAYGDKERSGEIADVEPLAPCRPVQAGKVYSCRLLVEHNDRRLAALGVDASAVLDGEFTFERDGAAGQWRTTAALPDELARAKAAARAKTAAQ